MGAWTADSKTHVSSMTEGGSCVVSVLAASRDLQVTSLETSSQSQLRATRKSQAQRTLVCKKQRILSKPLPRPEVKIVFESDRGSTTTLKALRHDLSFCPLSAPPGGETRAREG